MKKVLVSLLMFLFLLLVGMMLYFKISDCGISPFGCGDYSMDNNYNTSKIKVGSGPEDMAIDTSLGSPRIIVSCDERRKGKTKKGAFYAINPTTNEVSELIIENASMEIHPHGIDIVTIDSVTYLYAISHNQTDEKWRHPVVRFEIQGNRLLMDTDQIFEHELMCVPNDLDVLEDGSFYASNYIPNMNPVESTKAILGMKTGSIVHYDGKGNWQIAVKDLCYPNGIWVNKDQDHLLIANGGCREVARFKLEGKKVHTDQKESTKKYMDIPIGDNLLIDNQGVLWTAAHPCPLKFIDHVEDSANKSPVQIFAIDPATMKTSLVFQNNGDLINAASTAIRLNNRLYISQVFDPFILVVDGVEL